MTMTEISYFEAFTTEKDRARAFLGTVSAGYLAAQDAHLPSFVSTMLYDIAKKLGPEWKVDLSSARLYGDDAVSIKIGDKRYAVAKDAAVRAGKDIIENVIVPLIAQLSAQKPQVLN